MVSITFILYTFPLLAFALPRPQNPGPAFEETSAPIEAIPLVKDGVICAETTCTARFDVPPDATTRFCKIVDFSPAAKTLFNNIIGQRDLVGKNGQEGVITTTCGSAAVVEIFIGEEGVNEGAIVDFLQVQMEA